MATVLPNQSDALSASLSPQEVVNGGTCAFECSNVLILDISKLDLCLSLIGLLCSLCLCLSTHQLAVDATMHAAKHSDSKPNHSKLSHLELLFSSCFLLFFPFIHFVSFH